MEEAYDAGKIRAIVISNYYVDRMVDFVLSDKDMAAIDTKESFFFSHIDPKWLNGL